MKKPMITCLCMALVLSLMTPVVGADAQAAVQKKNARTATLSVSVKADSATTGSAAEPEEKGLKYYVQDAEIVISGVKGEWDPDKLEIPERIDGYPVTEIDYSAFSGMSFTNVSLPSTLKEISSYAFENCESLKEITIPASVNRLGSGAFYGCDALRSVTFKTTAITSISDNLFSYCKKLESIKIPSSVTEIGQHAFYRCSKLSNVSLNGKLVYIEDGAFREDYALTSVTIPASVKTVGDEAFYNCSKLAKVTFNGSKTKFGVRSFARCSALKSFKVPASMFEIPENAFYGCESLRTVTFPTKLKILKKNAFAECLKLTSIKIPKNVYAIGDQAFQNSGLKKIKLNKKLQYIGNGAFNGTNLSSVKLPGKVAYIGNRVFKNCDRLKTITIPASVKGLNPGAFGGCTSLKSIRVAAGNKNYSSQAGVLFDKEKTTLLQYPINKPSKSYTVPSSVKVIRSYAFEENRHLQTLSVGAQSIHHHAFSSMERLKSVTLTSGVRTIAAYAFGGDGALKNAVVPDSVTQIGDYAFSNTAITSMHISSSLKKLGAKPFYACNKLTAFTGNGSGTYRVIDGVLYSRSGQTLLQYPSSRKNASFTVPKGVTKVTGEAFRRAKNLKELYFEKSITYLNYAAITNCNKLRQVVFANGTKLKTGYSAIRSCPKLAVIVGPKQYILSSMASGANATLITL